MSFAQAFRGLANESMGLFGLADHGTELNKSQSDRLMMTTMGATTSITQRAVAPTAMGQSQSEKFRSALDMPASKETVAEKGYVVALGDWTTGNEEGQQLQEIHVPSIFKSSDYAIFGLLNYHEYIRCGIDVTVQINPTEWQIGGLIVWIESCQDTKSQLMTNFNNLLTYTSDILNCNVNNEVRLKQAFTYSRNLHELHQASNQPDDIFCVRIAVWSKLKVATGTSTKVSYKVTASLCDVEMHGMRVKAQMMKGISGYKPAGQMAIGPGIGAVNMSNMSEMHVNSHMTMGCEGFEMDASFAGGVECEDFSKHLSTPCRYGVVNWSTTKGAGTQLAKWKVHPRQPPNGYYTWASPGKQSTNISLLSSLYRYWRGDIIFVFQVFASKWHSGRLMLAFTPGQAEQISSNTTLKVVSTCSAAQYDIHGPQSTFVYRVPYISATQYLDCDPTKGFMGWLYMYIYTQMAAPSTVSTEVEIVCYMCGADNFELFVPSYNAVQMDPKGSDKVQIRDSKGKGDGKSEGIQDVAAAAVTSHGQDTASPQVFKESPMGALEMPQYKPSDAGTFPELKEGTRLHKKKHTDLSVLMGRAHFWTSFVYSTSQGFINDQELNWSKLKGMMEAVSKCFTLFRGGLKVVVNFETLFQAEVYMCFRPRGVEPLTTLEQMYKYGLVSFSTEQTHQVVLKLPWYQPIAANSVFSEYDAHFGYLTVAAQTSGTVKVHLAIAFDEDSRFYTPRGCPTDAHFQQSTKNSYFRMRRTLPDAVPTEVLGVDGTDGPDLGGLLAPDEMPTAFLRSSVARKGMYHSPAGDLAATKKKPQTTLERALGRVVGMKPEMAHMRGYYLCMRPSTRYPIDHYFLLLENGRQFGFQSENGEMFGRGVVTEEFNQEYEIVALAEEMAVVVQYMVGPFYRDYNFATYNCEHWARAYAGLGEKSTQTQKIMKFMGVAVLPVAAAMGAVRPQMQSDEEVDHIFTEFVSDCLSRYEKVVQAGKEVPFSLVECAERAKNIFQSKAGEGRISSGVMKDMLDIFDHLLGADTQSKDQAKSKEPKDTKSSSFMNKITKPFIKSTGDQISEQVEKVTKKTQIDVENWLKNTIMPTLESRGAKIAKKVINIAIDVAQAACLLHVAVNYPVPGVIGPIAAAGTLGALRGASRLLMKLSASANNTKAEMSDDYDVTEDMAGVLYECVIKHVPAEMEPQEAKAGFLERIKHFNIFASGVKNLVTLCKWLAECVKACVDYVLPTKKSRSARKLTAMTEHMEMVRVIYSAVASDMSPLSDRELNELADVTLELLRHTIVAQDLVKDRNLVSHLTKAYSGFKTEISRRAIQGDGLPRVEPIVIWLHGSKGCGKSLASIAVASLICKKMGLDPRKEIYTKPVSAKYYDGYKQQKVMVMDDVGQNTGPNNTEFDDFCQMVSTAPLRLNMAHLDEKGTQFKTPIIVASSNIGDPTPPGIADTDAIRRRICDHRFYVNVKSGYQRKVVGQAGIGEDSVVLDASRASKDGVLRSMKCCNFIKGLSGKGVEMSVDEIVDLAMDTLNRKTQTHKNIMEMWFDMAEEMGGSDQKKHHTHKSLVAICEKLEVKPTVDTKIVPVWTRVLLSLAVVATMIAGMAGVGCAIWGISGSGGKKKEQGAYNVTPTRPIVVRVPSPTESVEQAMHEVIQTARNNTVPVGMRIGERLVYKVQGLFVRQLQVLIPRHFMTSKGEKNLLINSRHGEFEYNHADLNIKELDWGGKGTDAVLVTLPKGGVTPYKDITRHFVKADNLMSFSGTCGVLVTNGTYGETFIPEENLEFFSETTYGTEVRYNPAGVFIAKAMTMDGMCGGTLVSSVNKYQNPILGIHVAGNGCMATTQVVTQEMLGQHEEAARIVGIADCANHGMSTKTQYTLSPLAPHFDSGKIPAVLGPSLKTDQDVFAMALAKYNVPVHDCPWDWAEYEHAFTKHFLLSFGRTKGTLDLEQAINGVEGLDGINMKTSPGYPWVSMGMRKRDLIKWHDGKWVATPLMEAAVSTHLAEVMEEVEGYDDRSSGLTNYERQAGWDPPIKYITYYKDELRPAEKVRAGKTRVIEAAPVHHVVAFRMIFGKAMANLHRSSLWGGFAPGCDIEMEAKYLHRKMQKYPWIFDADYAGFDGSLQPFVMMGAMRVLGHIGDIDPCTSQRWARLLIRSNHLWGSTELKVFGSMPSGSPATTIVNTISNLMMSYYAIMKATDVSMVQLFSQNLVVAYGDDTLLMSSDPELGNSMGKWAEVQKEVFEATVTSPDKSGAPKPVSWDEVVFLKRTFVMRDNDIFACLDKKSIEAMFEWQHESETFKSRILSALEFCAMWGREFYHDVCARLTFARIVGGVDVGLIPSYTVMRLSQIAKMSRH